MGKNGRISKILLFETGTQIKFVFYLKGRNGGFEPATKGL